MILEDKSQAGCGFCRNVVKCRQLPRCRDLQLYLSKEKAGLLQSVRLRKEGALPAPPQHVPHYTRIACQRSLKRKSTEDYSREVKMKHMLAAIVSLCFRGSCALRGKKAKKKKSTRFECRLSPPIISYQDPAHKLHESLQCLP